MNDNYLKFRGKCKELCEEAIKEDPTLRLVRGHYWCPMWNSEEQHWWTVREDGSIYDPSVLQFPSGATGTGIYTEFNGVVECAECGKEVLEENARFDGRYAFCSHTCICKFVGLM